MRKYAPMNAVFAKKKRVPTPKFADVILKNPSVTSDPSTATAIPKTLFIVITSIRSKSAKTIVQIGAKGWITAAVIEGELQRPKMKHNWFPKIPVKPNNKNAGKSDRLGSTLTSLESFLRIALSSQIYASARRIGVAATSRINANHSG